MDLSIMGVSKTFEETTALHPTDLTVQQGKFTTLLGPSGCGKTTLLRMIAGLERPDGGSIGFGDEMLFSSQHRINVPVHKRDLGMVFQDFALWPHMTVFENVAFGLRATKVKLSKDKLITVVHDALAKVKLSGMEQRYPHQLSGGQQQRVAFARAVAAMPRLVLFDEPLSALDAVLREDMRIEMMSLVRDLGLTALYVTHDQIEAMSMSDVVVVMEKGKVLQVGSPEQIYSQPTHLFVANFIGKSNWLEPAKTMFRPEHLGWERPSESCLSFTVKIEHVSYLGDRYEIRMTRLDDGITWTAYHYERKNEGDLCEVYVPNKYIHQI